MATVAACQTKTFENDMFTKVTDGGFHWSSMKSKLQLGPFAASFPLSQSRRKLQLIQAPEGASTPTALGQAGSRELLQAVHSTEVPHQAQAGILWSCLRCLWHC